MSKALDVAIGVDTTNRSIIIDVIDKSQAGRNEWIKRHQRGGEVMTTERSSSVDGGSRSVKRSRIDEDRIGRSTEVDHVTTGRESGSIRSEEDDIMGGQQHVAMDVGGIARDATGVNKRRVKRMGRREMRSSRATDEALAERHVEGEEER